MDCRPAVSEQYRPTNGAAEDGVYRVVGTDDDSVTLLQVGDEDGRRVHTGDVTAVSRATFDEEFTPAADPESGGRLSRAVAGVGVGFVAVAVLSWADVLVTPAPPGTLAALGLGLLLFGRVVDR
jgi:hypothetical protein